MDRYEIQRIVRDEAEDVRRDLERRIWELERQLTDLVQAERRIRMEADQELYDAIEEVGRRGGG